MLSNLFRKNKSSKKDTNLVLNDGSEIDFDIIWLQRELEFQHQDEKLQFRTNENQSLKFGELINSLFDIRKEELSVLSINDGELTTIEGEENIWNYEFLQHYKRNEAGEYVYYREGCSKLANQTILTLSYKTYEKSKSDKDRSLDKRDAILIVHLQHPVGEKDKVVYIQATFCLPTSRNEMSKNGVSNSPRSLSILIGFDLQSSEEIENELFKVLESAKAKVDSGNAKDLDYVESELFDIIHFPMIAKEYYYGKSVMSQNRFLDAIQCFKRAFHALQKKWWNKELLGNEFETMLECSYLIGFCYYELGLYEKSFWYLDFSARNAGNMHKYKSEFINCLIALKDVRSLMCIDQYLESLLSIEESERKVEDAEFYKNLLRRKAFCLIEFGDFDDAEKILKTILKGEPDNEFAKKELAYIAHLKNR